MLHDVVARILKVPAASISDATSPETLPRWDSLTHLDLMTGIEDAYGIRFSTADIMRAKSVGEVRLLLREKGLEVD
jgi:acyl carrier protein